MPTDAVTSPYTDEPEHIPDDAVLFRRVPAAWVDYGTTTSSGEPGLSSAAFQDYSDEQAAAVGCPGPAMSVHIAEIVLQEGRSPEDLLEDPSYGLARFTAADLRANDQGVQRWPTSVDPSHAVVFSTRGRKRSKSQQKRLRDAATWEVLPLVAQ